MKRHMFKPASSVVFLLLVLGATTGCPHKTSTGGGKPNPPEMSVVSLILHGPVLVITKEDGTTVLVPRDKEEVHELVSPYPTAESHIHESSDGCKSTVEFELQGANPSRTTSIDPTFDPVRFHVPGWKENSGQEMFVRMKLPLPRTIYSAGHLHGVYFSGKPGDPPTLAWVPLTQVLEFRTSDIKNVKLVRTVVKTCGGEKQPVQTEREIPLSCGEMGKKYNAYFASMTDLEEAESDRPYLLQLFRQCDDAPRFLFVSVGPGADTYAKLDRYEREKHGIDFFNEKLLPLASDGEFERYKHRRLVPNPNQRPLYNPNQEDRSPLPRLIGASYRPLQGSYRRPMLMPVMFALVENCTSASALVTTKKH